MPDTLKFSYFLSHSDNPVTQDSPAWKAPLPLSRKQLDGDLEKEADISISNGDYFYSVRSFLTQKRCAIITSAVAHHFGRDIEPEEVEEIRICLEKHGEFYHPSKIEIVFPETVVLCVANVAVSAVGNAFIRRESETMQRLNNDFPNSFIPKVHGYGKTITKESRREIRMFLGEWFEGFNEFHISRDKTDEKIKLVVWDPVHGNFFLSKEQATEIYSQAAMILTYYYNIETFEHISLWHHAAGDFVVKLQDKKIELKLVTARQYAPMFEDIETEEKASGAELMLEALLIFLLNLTLRMRLDRLDGIGDMVWSNNIAIEGTLRGFFRGLALKSKHGLIPEQLVNFFQNYLLHCAEADLFDLFQTVAHRYNPDAPEFFLIKENFKAHAANFYSAINNI
jgi:hypothetical protein